MADTNASAVRWQAIRSSLDMLATIAVIVAVGIFAWRSFRESPAPRSPGFEPPSEPVDVEGAQSLGSPGATVGLIEYSDFQCPFCASFALETFPQLKTKYVDTGQVRVLFRHHPLEIHPLAPGAALIAECAGAQGQFWPTHDVLFAAFRQKPAPENTAQLIALVPSALDRTVLERCLANDPPESIAKGVDQAKAYNLTGTPAFYVGRFDPQGRVAVSSVIRGAKPLSEFSSAIDSLLR